MPQPPPGEARSPPLRLLPPGRPCEFPGCGGKDGRDGGGCPRVRGSLQPAESPACAGAAACPASSPACDTAPSPGAPGTPSAGRSRALGGRRLRLPPVLPPPGQPAPPSGLGTGNRRASPGLGSPRPVPSPGGPRRVRCSCAREFVGLSLKLCCGWSWGSQPRCPTPPPRDRGPRSVGARGSGCCQRFAGLMPGIPQPPRERCPSAPALPVRLSVRPSVERGAGRAAASLRAVKAGVDARQPRRSCQALSLLAFPSLRPSLRGALLSRSPALRLFMPPGSAAALRRGPDRRRGAPGAPTGRDRETGRAGLPSPTGTGPAGWQKAVCVCV